MIGADEYAPIRSGKPSVVLKCDVCGGAAVYGAKENGTLKCLCETCLDNLHNENGQAAAEAIDSDDEQIIVNFDTPQTVPPGEEREHLLGAARRSAVERRSEEWIRKEISILSEECIAEIDPTLIEEIIEQVQREYPGLERIEENIKSFDDGECRLGFTDMDMARRMYRMHHEALRFFRTEGKDGEWLYWDSRRWVHDRTNAARRKAWLTVQQAINELELERTVQEERGIEIDKKLSEDIPKEEKDLLIEERKSVIAKIRTFTRHIEVIQSRNKISSMLAETAALPGVAADPQDFDTDLYSLNLLNGTYNLETHKLEPHNREHKITRLAPTRYDPAAKAPLFNRFLERVQPDQEIREYLQRWFGYCLTGDIGEGIITIFIGNGANGKSVLLSVLSDVIQEYARTTEVGAFTEDQDSKAEIGKADLKGHRMVLAIESKKEGVRINEGMVKQITGGDKIKGRKLYGMPFEFKPTFKVTFSVNSKPLINDTTNSMRRRLAFVPFDVMIPKEEQDIHLTDKLMEERSGILNWMIEGLKAYQHNGLKPPESVTQATTEYMEDMDLFGQMAQVTWFFSETQVTFASTLFHSHTIYQKKIGSKPLGLRTFYEKLEKWAKEQSTEHPFIKKDRDRRGVFYSGIAIYNEYLTETLDRDPKQDYTNGTGR